MGKVRELVRTPSHTGPTVSPLIVEQARELKTRAYSDIPLDTIREQANVRSSYNSDSIIELSESIRAVGLLSPILLKENETSGYTIINGHRRFRACKLLGLVTIKAFILKQMSPSSTSVFSEDARVMLQLTENIQRENLSDNDLELVIEELAKTHKQHEIATMIHKSQAWVSTILAASNARSTAINRDKNHESHFRALSTKDWYTLSRLPQEDQESRLNLLLQGNETVDEGIAKVRESSKVVKGSKIPSSAIDPDVLPKPVEVSVVVEIAFVSTDNGRHTLRMKVNRRGIIDETIVSLIGTKISEFVPELQLAVDKLDTMPHRVLHSEVDILDTEPDLLQE